MRYAVVWYVLCRVGMRYAVLPRYGLCRGLVDKSGPTVGKPALE